MPQDNLTKQEIIELFEKLLIERSMQIKQGDIVKRAVKQRHLEADLIFRGVAASKPDGSSEVKCYFATDTGVLSIWDGSDWLEVTLG